MSSTPAQLVTSIKAQLDALAAMIPAPAPVPPVPDPVPPVPVPPVPVPPVPTPPLPIPPGGSGQAVNAGSKLTWTTTPSEATLEWIAANCSWVILDGYPICNAAAPKLRALNPDLIVMPYIAGPELTNDSNVSPGFASALAQAPSWQLRATNGVGVYDRGAPGISGRVMDPANSAWITWRQAQIKWYLNLGYNGIFFDEMAAAISISTFSATPVNPRTKVAYTNAQWGADMATYTAACKAACGDNMLVVNSLLSGHYYSLFKAQTDLVNDQADAAISEGFCQFAPDTSPRNVTDWKADIDMIATIEARGKAIPVGWMDTPPFMRSDADKGGMFALGSYLLGCGASARRWFNYQDWKSSGREPAGVQPSSANLVLAVGEPVSPYTVSGGLYSRKFTHGTVTVDPAAQTGKITLSGV